MTLSAFVTVIGGLAVFLYGMKVMSEALQSVAGDKMRSVLAKATNNRVLGVVTGFSVTAVIQSSSATTVMMVGFVSAGLLSLSQATGIIMGANIGTTVTGWIVSLLGFKVKIAAFALPAVAVGFFVRFLKRERLTFWGEVLVGFGILFLGLSFLKEALPDIKQSPELAAWLHRWAADTYLSTLGVILIGTLITVLVQSSSAVMAVTLSAAANGLIDFETGAALVLGENIGTTVTAILAAIGGSRESMRAASIHTLFNLLGVAWVWLAFPLVTGVVDGIVPGVADQPDNIPNHLAAFHTLFNVTNTVLFLPFSGYLVAAARRLIPDDDEVERPRLQTLATTYVSMPGIALAETRGELHRMLSNVREMHAETSALIRDPKADPLQRTERVKALEAEVNSFEHQIYVFLTNLSRHKTSSEVTSEVALLLDMANELERMGDRFVDALAISERRRERGVTFSDATLEQFEQLSRGTEEFINLIAEGMLKGEDVFERACAKKDELNALRNEIRTAKLERLRSEVSSVEAVVLFSTLVSILEKVCDHGIRVAAAMGKHQTS